MGSRGVDHVGIVPGGQALTGQPLPASLSGLATRLQAAEPDDSIFMVNHRND